ncbi:MAG: cysteine--tRNA ligase [Thermotogae bacterium]|nr:cysteine--tRNA ligase [Thermotogota bacterium]
MYLYNTLTGRKEEFAPLRDNTVRAYVCGMTVQDSPHVGHMRVFTVFDALFRFFKALGWDVVAVQNFTDIDDKIISKAAEEGIDWRFLADRYEQEYREVARRMNFLPLLHPRATQHIQEIVEMIQAIIDNGYAYVREGNVWFSVRKFARDYGYGKLAKMSLDEMMAGARVEPDPTKEDPLDFALWKAHKEGEPYWYSPWGKGRPGWHIECSAMSSKHLGLPLDIHGGGRDLIFPHHEDEIAQTEAATGQTFARFWMHVGLLTFRGEKMSKSLRNYFIAKEILAEYSPDTLRHLLLSAHYRSDLEFYPEKLREHAKAVARLKDALARVPEDAEEDASFRDDLHAALKDDFNTPEAFGLLFSALDSPTPSKLATVRGFLRMLGFRLGEEEKDDTLERLVALRLDARRRKDYALADTIRDVLKAVGVELMDTPEGTKVRKVR